MIYLQAIMSPSKEAKQRTPGAWWNGDFLYVCQHFFQIWWTKIKFVFSQARCLLTKTDRESVFMEKTTLSKKGFLDGVGTLTGNVDLTHAYTSCSSHLYAFVLVAEITMSEHPFITLLGEDHWPVVRWWLKNTRTVLTMSTKARYWYVTKDRLKNI